MKQAEKIREALKKAKSEMFEVFNKNITAQQILESPEEAYAVGKLLKLYNDFEQLAYDQASQIDEMEELLRNSYELIRKLDEQIVELRKEVKAR